MKEVGRVKGKIQEEVKESESSSEGKNRKGIQEKGETWKNRQADMERHRGRGVSGSGGGKGRETEKRGTKGREGKRGMREIYLPRSVGVTYFIISLHAYNRNDTRFGNT